MCFSRTLFPLSWSLKNSRRRDNSGHRLVLLKLTEEPRPGQEMAHQDNTGILAEPALSLTSLPFPACLLSSHKPRSALACRVLDMTRGHSECLPTARHCYGPLAGSLSPTYPRCRVLPAFPAQSEHKRSTLGGSSGPLVLSKLFLHMQAGWRGVMVIPTNGSPVCLSF